MIKSRLRCSALAFAGVLLSSLLLPTSTAIATNTSIEDVLDRQAEAIRTRNASAAVSSVDRMATERYRTKQGQQVSALLSVSLSSYDLTLLADDANDIGNALDLKSRYRADEVEVRQVRQAVTIASYDTRPELDEFWLTFVRRGDDWFIGSDSDAEKLGLSSARTIWDAGAFESIASEHFLTLYKPEQAARARQISTTAELAIKRFAKNWATPWSQKLPMVVPESVDEAAALLETRSDVSDFVGFVSYRTTRDNGWQVGSPRLIIQDANLAAASPTSQVETLVHEISHAASSEYIGPYTPTWMQEGLAEYVRQNRSKTISPGSSGRLELPSASRFAASGNELTTAYSDSASAMSFLAARFGTDVPERLFVALGARRVEPGTPSNNVDQAFRSVTNQSIEDFVADWNAHFNR